MSVTVPKFFAAGLNNIARTPQWDSSENNTRKQASIVQSSKRQAPVKSNYLEDFLKEDYQQAAAQSQPVTQQPLNIQQTQVQHTLKQSPKTKNNDYDKSSKSISHRNIQQETNKQDQSLFYNDLVSSNTAKYIPIKKNSEVQQTLQQKQNNQKQNHSSSHFSNEQKTRTIDIYNEQVNNKAILEQISQQQARLQKLQQLLKNDDVCIKLMDQQITKVQDSKLQKQLLQQQKDMVEIEKIQSIQQQKQINQINKQQLKSAAQVSVQKYKSTKKQQVEEAKLLSQIAKQKIEADLVEHIRKTHKHADDLREFQPTWKERVEAQQEIKRKQIESEKAAQLFSWEIEKEKNIQILVELQQQEQLAHQEVLRMKEKRNKKALELNNVLQGYKNQNDDHNM